MEETLQKDFPLVTMSDLPKLQHYLSLANYEEANHNVVGFVLWSHAYPLWKYETDHWILLFGVYEGSLFVYMPLCESCYFKEAILAAYAVFQRYDVPLQFMCYTKEAIQQVVEILPSYTYEECRDIADYVYECEKLRNFSGKKLQKKRNHLNAFYKQYEGCWSYEDLDPSIFEECIAFLMQWHEDDDNYMLAYEKLGILSLFEHWDKLPICGGVIRIHGEIKALTIASSLSSRMGQVHVEKADDQIRGLYQAICKEFLVHNFFDKEYVNREDDMGIPELRKAKEAYQPAFYIMKYRLRRKEDASSTT